MMALTLPEPLCCEVGPIELRDLSGSGLITSS